MKEIITVNISGISFIFDQEAYYELNNYLEKLELGYKNNPEGREIIADIEARIAEIILSKQESEQIVNLDMTQSIIDRMGFPDDLEQNIIPGKSNEFSRRLYRNPEGRKLAGICSGIGTFLNIDPILIRLAIFVPLVLLIITAPICSGGLSALLGTTCGAIFMLYFILWFSIPLAQSPRQKLEMRGERITASSIHNNFQQELSTVSDPRHSQRSASVLTELIYVLGRIILFMIRIFALFIGAILAVAAMGTIVGLICFTFGCCTIESPAIADLNSMFHLNGVSLSATLSLIALAVLLPMLMVIYLLVKFVFNIKTNKPVLSVIFGIWIIITLFSGVMLVKNIDNIRKIVIEQSNGAYFNFSSNCDDNNDCNDQDVVVSTQSVVETDSTRVDSIQIVISKPQQNGNH